MKTIKVKNALLAGLVSFALLPLPAMSGGGFADEEGERTNTSIQHHYWVHPNKGTKSTTGKCLLT
jgi:hypothetical protein